MDIIDPMMDEVNKRKTKHTNNSLHQREHDAQIKGNPLEAGFEVADARSERTVFDANGVWVAKQNGL